jgi:alpha-D-ribose 1-methylphosphonate 5-triphosphate synthase subunit PhnH
MIPIISPLEAQTRSTFLALMWAFSRPGRLYEMPSDGPAGVAHHCALIGKTLLDLETSFYTPDPELAQELALTGARTYASNHAAYLFFPSLTEQDLPLLEQASNGDYLYPDRSATLVIGCRWKDPHGARLRLSGPGIAQQTRAQIGGLPEAFWALREAHSRYPLGWDIYLLSGHYVIGLPRTTRVEMEVL